MDNLVVVFKSLLDTCIVSSILILFVFLVKSLVKNKISANIIYFLWLILLIRLVFPFSIPSKVSIENIYPKSEVTAPIEKYSDEDVEVNYSDISKEIYKPIISNADKAYRLFTYVWLFGIFAIMFIPIISYITLKRELFKDENAVNDIVSKASVDARTKLSITTSFKIVYSYYLDAPALIGVFCPMIVLPINKKDADYDTIFNILLHEFVHYKKRHLFFQWIFWIVKAIYWFNPLVWLAHTMMKHEAELACDEQVMRIIGEENKKEYGSLLIDLADNIHKANYTVNAAGLLNNKSELKKRIVRLSKRINQSKAVKYVSYILIIMMLPIFFTSYTVDRLEIVEKIITKDINSKVLVSDNILINLEKYEYNTITEKLKVYLNYELDKELYDRLKDPSQMSLYFALEFPGSIDPEIRQKGTSQVANAFLNSSNIGETICEFELENYNQDRYGKAKLVFEGAQVRRELNKVKELEINKNELPVSEQIDDLFSINYYYLAQGKEQNSIDIKYKIESPMDIRVSLWEQYFLVNKKTLSEASGSSDENNTAGKGSVLLTGSVGTSGSMSDESYEMTIKYNTNTENTDTVILRLKSYTVFLGMNQAMLRYEEDKIAWRFDVEIKDGDIEYE